MKHQPVIQLNYLDWSTNSKLVTILNTLNLPTNHIDHMVTRPTRKNNQN